MRAATLDALVYGRRLVLLGALTACALSCRSAVLAPGEADAAPSSEAAVAASADPTPVPSPPTPDPPASAPTTDATADSPAAAYLNDPEAVALGSRYFRAVCTGYCHSTQVGVARTAPDLFDCEWRHGASDEDVFGVLVEGVPDTEMLPFGGKLPDDSLWKIVAYLRAQSRCR